MVGYIYQIINNQTQERYIGQTVNLTKRLSDHKNKLNKNIHVNAKLQNAWNKYGADSFSFVFDEYEIELRSDLDKLEIAAIKKYDSYYHGYNLTLGGDGGNTKGKLSFDDYCFIYIGCQWSGYTEKIGKYLNIDSSTVSSILRDKAYLWYREKAIALSQESKELIINNFRKTFGISTKKPYDQSRIHKGLTEDDYFYCLCIASCYSRGIEAALAKYFGKHKSFLSNGTKGKTKGKAYLALQRFQKLSKEEVQQIGKEKFEEWNIQSYSSLNLILLWNNKWRN